ncbi:hypothetical protein GGE65_007842 [Skermanella aerolata]|uniref:hypothetical protein n=1 Tax=Skermanella aerolata TaxID=393310 RepID=UPI003D1FB9BC
MKAFIATVLAGTAFSVPGFSQTVIDLNDPANAGRTVWKVPPGIDVRVIGSAAPRTRQMSIQGARNVDVRGGIWKPTVREYDGTIHTRDITGSLTITGATIDNSAVHGADGVIVNAGGDTRIPFLMKNSTITGIRGNQAGDHADGVQPQGQVSTFRMENVRIDTDFQGLMLADQPEVAYGGKVGSISLTNVAISKLPGGESGCRYPIVTGGHQTVSLSGVTVFSQPGCRGNGVLNVDNRARISGDVAYGAAPASVTGAAAGVSPTVTPGGETTGWAEAAVRNMTARGLSTEQIKAEFASQGITLTASMIDALAGGALGTSPGLQSAVADALRGGGNPAGLQQYLVNEGYLQASDLVRDAVPDLSGYLGGFTGSGWGCDMKAALAGVAGIAGSAVNGLFTGGRSTVWAQITQIFTEYQKAMCDEERARLQARAVQGMTVNTATKSPAIIWETSAPLKAYDPAKMANDYMATSRRDMTPEESLAAMAAMRTRSDAAAQQAAREAVENARRQQQLAGIASQAMGAVMSAPGPTAATQGLAQIVVTQMAQSAAQAAADGAFAIRQLEAEEEQRAGELLGQQRRDRLYRRLAPENAPPTAPFQIFQ